MGQSRSASGAVMDSGFKGDILHFNMWQREFLSQDALDLYENCSIQLGTLVPWTELLQRLHGDVKKVEFVRCQPDGKKFLLNTILCVYRETKEAEIESRGFVNFTKAIFRN